MTQKLTDQVVTQLNDLPGFPARPNTVPPAPDRWVLGDWLVECRVNPEVANAAALPLTGNRVGDVRASLADQLWFIWDGAAWQPMAGGGGAVAAVTASAPIASSGGANPNISFPSWPANAAGSLSNDGAGNLSWSAAGGITGSGTNGYLTLWDGVSTVTGVNNGTNEGLLWKLNPNYINAMGVRGWAFFGPDIGNQIWLEVPGSNYTPPDSYVCDVKMVRNNTSWKQGIQFAQFDGTPNAITYNWFFGQVPDSGYQRAVGGKVVLYAGDNGTAKPDGTQSFVTFRQQAIGFFPDPGQVIVNENQQDHDFRVAGTTDANALFVDGSTSNVGIGTPLPTATLTARNLTDSATAYEFQRLATDTGTATGVQTAFTLQDTTKTWAVNQYVGATVTTTGGTGAGQTRQVVSNTVDTLTITPAWTSAIAGDTTYSVSGSTVLGVDTLNARVGINTPLPATALSLASGQFSVPDGTALQPSIALGSNLDTGFYKGTTGGATVVTNEAVSLSLNNNEAVGFRDLSLGGVTGTQLFVGVSAAGSSTNTIGLLTLGQRTTGGEALSPFSAMIEAHIDDTVTGSGVGCALYTYGSEPVSTGSVSSGFLAKKARGTQASPAVVQSGDVLGQFVGQGYDGNASGGFTANASSAKMQVVAAETFVNGTNNGALLDFYTVPTGSTTTTARMRIAANGNVGVNETAPPNRLTVAGSFGPEIDTTAVSPTTLDDTHYTMLCDTSGGAITVNLPAASTCARRVYVVKNIEVNAVTVQANGAETIDGANTYSLAAQWDHVMIQSDGSAWYVIG